MRRRRRRVYGNRNPTRQSRAGTKSIFQLRRIRIRHGITKKSTSERARFSGPLEPETEVVRGNRRSSFPLIPIGAIHADFTLVH